MRKPVYAICEKQRPRRSACASVCQLNLLHDSVVIEGMSGLQVLTGCYTNDHLHFDFKCL